MLLRPSNRAASEVRLKRIEVFEKCASCFLALRILSAVDKETVVLGGGTRMLGILLGEFGKGFLYGDVLFLDLKCFYFGDWGCQSSRSKGQSMTTCPAQ